ncbi:MAG: hypothetical protein AB7V04_03000 [Desulfomonilaceae bacterium]
MRYICKTVAVCLLILLMALGTAMAVGFERYDVSGVPDPSNKVVENANRNVYGAIKQASFSDHVPAVLDEISFFVRDVLGQFGLGHDKDQ